MFNKMFTNIGAKLKKLAKVLCWIGIVASVISAIFCFVQAARWYAYGRGTSFVLGGFAALIGGPLFSWLGSLGLYAFGEMTENTTITAELLAKADAEKK